MSKLLKTQVIDALKSSIATFVDIPATRIDNRHKSSSGRHYRGVRYFRADTGIDMLWGAMDEEKLGRKYKKRIVVRPSRFCDGLYELYTFHFPKKWSAACVANRELIKEAQRQARSGTQSLRLFLSIYLRLHLPRAPGSSTRSQRPPNPAITCHNRRATQALCGRCHLRTRLSQNQPSSPYSFPYAR